jgi:hypothetical protein
MEGSMNAKEWETIDHCKTEKFSGPLIVERFRCSFLCLPGLGRDVRLTRTGKNASRTDDLVLCIVKFFGSLRLGSSEEIGIGEPTVFNRVKKLLNGSSSGGIIQLFDRPVMCK